MQAQVEKATRRVLFVGEWPTGSPDPQNIDIIDIDAETYRLLIKPGEKTLGLDLSIVTAPLPTPIIKYSDTLPINVLAHTTDASSKEAWRLALDLSTGYSGVVTMIGVDSGNGAVRSIRVSFAVKRLNAGAVAVGVPVVLASHADALAAAWTITSSVIGNDFVVFVTGAVGRTIDWMIRGEMIRFGPGGILSI